MIQMGLFRKVVNKRYDHIPIKQKPLTSVGIGHIGKLVRGDVQLFCQNLPVAGGLVEHINEIAVFKDILDLPGRNPFVSITNNKARRSGKCLIKRQQKDQLLKVK